MNFWVKPTGRRSPGQYISDSGAGLNSPAIIWDFTPDKLEVFTPSYARTGSDGPTLLLNTWYHVVIGFKDNATTDITTFIVNGDVTHKLTSTALSKQVFSAKDAPLAIGACQQGFWNGLTRIDEYAVYDLSGMSQAQYDAKLVRLAAHYSAKPRPSVEPAIESSAEAAVGVSPQCNDDSESSTNSATLRRLASPTAPPSEKEAR